MGVGWSDDPNSYHAASEAAFEAVKAISQNEYHLALLFATGRHDCPAVREGVRAVLGETCSLVGGNAAGVIVNDRLGYDGYQIGVAVFHFADTVQLDIISKSGLADNEEKIGCQLGDAIRKESYQGEPSIVLLYDAINRLSGTLKYNMSSNLLGGLWQSIGPNNRLVGAGYVGAVACHEGYQWLDDKVCQQTATALMFSGSINIHSQVMHGCHPASSYHTVTRAEKNVIYEIDGEPALDKVQEIMGNDPSLTWKDLAFFLTLGVNYGDKYGPFVEENYVNRMCMRVDKAQKAIVLFEPDLVEGSQFQIMRRKVDFDYIHFNVNKLMNALEGKKPIFALYINCTGRCAAYSGMEQEEAAEIQKAMGDIPLLGFYSALEIGSVGGCAVGLNWTGVLCLFTEDIEKNSLPFQFNRPKKEIGFRRNTVPRDDIFRDVDIEDKLAVQHQLAVMQSAVNYYRNLTDEMAGLNVRNNSKISTVSNALRQKNEGFSLLASMDEEIGHYRTLVKLGYSVLSKLNTSMNMDKSLLLFPGDDAKFYPKVWQGYSTEEQEYLSHLVINYDSAWMSLGFLLINRATKMNDSLARLRDMLMLPYFIAVPIVEEGSIVALLIAGRIKETKPFFPPLDQVDVDSMSALARFIAHANQISRHRTELEQFNRNLEFMVDQRTRVLRSHNEQIAALNALSAKLQTVGSIEEAFDELKNSITEIFPDSLGEIVYRQDNEKPCLLRFDWGEKKVVDAVKKGEEIFVERQFVRALDSNKIDNGVFELKLLLRKETPWEKEKPHAVLRHLRLAFQNILLQEYLSYIANHDALTGLLNRRQSEKLIEKELSQAKRYNRAVSLILVDVDFFKKINDTYGHGMGDRVLSVLGESFPGMVRRSDVVSRYGGEEFLILLPETSLKGAHRLAEQIRKSILDMDIHKDGITLPSLSASLGVSSFPEHGQSVDELLKAADDALYQAKEKGRNRVESLLLDTE